MDLQQLIAISIALLAGAYLARRSWHSLRGQRSGCGSCAACPSRNSDRMFPATQPLYQLGGKPTARKSSS